MVYYFTSFNVKQLRKISEEYAQHPDCPPDEYMKRYVYVDHFPDSMDGDKLTWIVDTFLDLQKHRPFLQDVCSKVDSDMPPVERQYLVIILYAVLFQIFPEDKEHLYRCTFNLGKALIRRFATVFCNNEMIPFVSQLARVHYDDEFVTNRIIAPLFSWQPYISDMCHDFESHIQKGCYKMKVSTTPSPTIMLGKAHPGQSLNSADTTTVDAKIPNIPKKKMLTKSAIDLRLQYISEQNKLKAERLLKEVKTLEVACARSKSAKADTTANMQKGKNQRPPIAAKTTRTALVKGCNKSTRTNKAADKSE